jgi:6-phosphogluconate dehydrogenase
MVHNGIEYGLMQIIAEAYDLLRKRWALKPEQIADVFENWNKGRLKSFLFEITVGILRSKDDLTGKAMVDVISDRAGQKGTGRWASQAAMDLGVAVPNIDVAVTQREISALSDLRGELDMIRSDSRESIASDNSLSIANLEEAVYCASSVTYLQGFHLMARASKAKDYNIDFDSVAAVWRAGCIIRSAILAEIASVLAKRVDAAALLSEPETSSRISATFSGLASTVVAAAKSGVPAPGLSAAFNYLLSMSSDSLPTNLIQAQRDRFGSHTFKRVDREGDFHKTDWE